MEKTNVWKRRAFSAEFKQDALKRAASPGYTIDTAATSLGISSGAIQESRQAEKKEGRDAFRGNGEHTAEGKRIGQLEKVVQEIRSERDIKGKAAVYFAANQRGDVSNLCGGTK